MKKAIISALCSGLVIPGLGQILNQHIKKGIVILAAVFFLFIFLVIDLYMVLNQVFKASSPPPLDAKSLVEAFKAQNPTILYWIVVVFLLLWLYSVVDAFVYGLKVDNGEQNSP